MRRILLSVLSIALMLAAAAAYAQSPPGINYQGIARNPDGKPLAQKEITIRINILNNGANGDVEYSEVHSITTNSFGLFTLVIGNGNAEGKDFRFIDWSVGNKWLHVEMDPDGGNSFQLMGSQQFMSVPYAFYARYTGSSLTAGQGISIINNQVNNTGDADASATNELNSDVVLGPDHILRITDAGGTKAADLSSLITPGSTPQELSITANELAITEGNSVSLAPYLDNTDNQNLSLSGNNLNISGGSGVSLAPYLDNTDNQNLSLSGNTLNISGGTGISLAPYLDNTDNQNLSFSGTTLSISGGTGANLSSLRQDLSSTVSGTQRTIAITNGSSTTIDVADNDNNATNEIQDLSRSGNTLSLSSDATPVDLTPYLDDTDEQRLTLTGTTLSIDRGNTVSLAGLLDDTDDQDLSLNAATNSLSLTGDPTPVNLSAYMDNTDNQNLSITSLGTNRTINIQNGTGVTFSVADGDSDAANELQTLAYNTTTKTLSISTGNSVAIPETQTLNQVLLQGNDANGQRITNLAAPTANTDAVTKQYVDNADAAINSRLSTNYSFKTNFAFSALLAGSNITLPLADGTGSFDDFGVVNASNFTAPSAGTYIFTVDGSISSILVGSAINLLFDGVKYPVSVGSNNRYNTTLMFRMTAGQTITLVADGLGLGTNIAGSFMGYKLP